jgi:cell division protein FtsX
MSVILTVLAVLVTFTIFTALLLLLISLPTIIKGYKQQREDEHALAEHLSAQVKAARHRNVT